MKYSSGMILQLMIYYLIQDVLTIITLILLLFS